jgi:tetratricopeptide (TPR) repeat protein
MAKKHFMNTFFFKRFLAFLTLFVFVFQPFAIFAFEVNKAAIAILAVKDKEGEIAASGTGFIVKPDGVLVTNYHVLIDAASIDAVFPDGTVANVKEVVYVDRTKDFAILKLSSGLFSTLELGDSDSLKDFNYVSALGYLTDEVSTSLKPKGKLRQNHGMILGVHPQANPNFKMIYSTASLGPGFSGGPLIDENNRVVGIASAEGRALNLALPINEIKAFLNEKNTISLTEFLKRDGIFPQSFYYRGNFALYGQGEVDKAVELFNKTLTQLPDFILARYDLAVAYRNQGSVDQAISEYEKALQINPNFPEALSNLGGQYFRVGKIDKAIDTLKRAVKSFPNFIQANSNLGAVLNKNKKYEEAIPYLKKTVQLDPEFGMAHYNLGNAYFGVKELKKARASLEKASNLGIEFVSLHWKLYEIHKEFGDIERSRKELNIILEIDPENEEAKQKLMQEKGA